MKKILFFLLSLLTFINVSAVESEYIPLVREGVKWVYLQYEQTHNELKVTPSYLYSLEIKGDSLDQNNGNLYKKVYYTLLNKDFQPEDDSQLVGLVREENGVIYRKLLRMSGYDVDNQPICQPFWVENLMEYEIYNFNRETYLPDLPYYSDEFYNTTNQIFRNNPYQTTVQVGESERNAYVFNDINGAEISKFFLAGKVIEGIGIDSRSGNLLAPQLDIKESWNSLPGLVEVIEGDEIVYKGVLYDDAILYSQGRSDEPHQYIPITREGVKWEYVAYNSVYGLQPDKVEVYTLEFNGETEEGHKLFKADYDAQWHLKQPQLVAYVKEEDKSVTIDWVSSYYEFATEECHIYDFNTPLFLPYVSEMSPYNDCYFRNFTQEIGGTLRLGCDINYDVGESYYSDFLHTKIIEGIGVDCLFGDLLHPFTQFVTGGGGHYNKELPNTSVGQTFAALSAVYENGELVYKGCAYDKVQEFKALAAIDAVATVKPVSSVRYYNLAGVESAEPLDGVSIKVTTYTDGTRKCEKVVR